MGCDHRHFLHSGSVLISIHASRMGCDSDCRCKWRCRCHFNPRIPYGMRLLDHDAALPKARISIHASRMGCDDGIRPLAGNVHISIHASRMGCDDLVQSKHTDGKDFNPRIPYGMRRMKCSKRRTAPYFNPRIPYGMRLGITNFPTFMTVFQSTHPVWDATLPRAIMKTRSLISIHASRMGCDWDISAFNHPARNFNPRIPYGMRRQIPPAAMRSIGISIHASRMGCDCENGHCIP